MSSATNQHDLLTRLRAEIRRIERRPARRAGGLPCGVAAVDALLPGGFPCGALSELRGGPASGKTAVALSLVAGLGRRGPEGAGRPHGGALAAWIDGRGELYPPAAAAMGVDLSRLLIVRPPPDEEGARLALWAAEVLLGSGAFAAVTIDAALARPWRGIEASLHRLVTAAEQGGAAGLWLSSPGAAVRPPALVRLDLRVVGRRIVASHAARSGGQEGAPRSAGSSPAPRAGGVHAA